MDKKIIKILIQSFFSIMYTFLGYIMGILVGSSLIFTLFSSLSNVWQTIIVFVTALIFGLIGYIISRVLW